MRQSVGPSIFALLSLSGAQLSLQAQGGSVQEEINLWFQEERFIIADRNDDALLDKSEMAHFAEEFAYYLVPRHYGQTDKNQDGMLSFHEVLARSNSEKLYRYNLERRELRALARDYPLLAQADEKSLKKNPALVTQLFSNLLWLSEHTELAEQLYNNHFWTANHPEAIRALHRNLRWMAANPTEAEDLYRDRSATRHVPELLGWRAHHKDFIRRHPSLDDFYRSAFFPGSIRH